MSTELALVHHAATPAEATLLKGFLVSEGFSAVIPGSELADEFGASQRVLGTMGVRVLVPASELEQAKEAFAAWQSAKPLTSTEESGDATSTPDKA